jgi:hypothetical protein
MKQTIFNFVTNLETLFSWLRNTGRSFSLMNATPLDSLEKLEGNLLFEYEI